MLACTEQCGSTMLQFLNDDGRRRSSLLRRVSMELSGEPVIRTPLQTPAAPYWPDWSAWTNETMIRAPELPIA